MKILYFHQHFTLPTGSGGIRSYQMARQLIAAGHEVTMVCGSHSIAKTGLSGPFLNGRRVGMHEGIRIIEFNLTYGNDDGFLKRSLTFLKYALSSIDVALREQTDMVFATTTPLTAGIPGIFAKWFRRKPFCFEVRDLWPELPREMGVITNPLILGLMGGLEWMSYKSADRLIGLSPGIVAGIARYVPDQSRIAMITNGCDLELFGVDGEPWRPEQVRPDDFMAIFTGAHGPANGLDALVDAAVVLKARGVKNIKLVLVGDGREKPRLMRRAQQERLGDIVIFHDLVPKTKLVGLMQSADVGLQILADVPAFYYGTSPNKFFDYISAGLPVITNYPGWVAELVIAHDCGTAIPARNPEAFADALIAMHGNPSRNIMAENAKTLAQTDFARDKLGGEFVEWVVGTVINGGNEVANRDY